VKLLGEQLRKDGARGLDIRPAKLVSRLSELQASGVSGHPSFRPRIRCCNGSKIEEVLGGERAPKAERAKKPEPAKTAGERRRPGEGNWREGNSPAWRGGGSIGG
jgi:hypothetical protein